MIRKAGILSINGMSRMIGVTRVNEVTWLIFFVRDECVESANCERLG